MKVAILGTRGIPNHHGGFEQFAEYFSVYLAEEGYEVYVYNSSLHPYKEKIYKGVNIICCKDPENKIGTAGQFIYDLNCILDSRKRNFDVILQLGYTSSSIWHFLLPKKSVIVTNMDGLEWKRSKYSKKTQKFLKFAEKLAANYGGYLIADSIGIQEYIKEEYKKHTKYIAYGAEIFSNPDPEIIKQFELVPYQYHLLIARMEPENNIETIIKGIVENKSKKPLILVGNYKNTPFGKYLYENYSNNSNIKFIGAVYDIEILNNLRYFSDMYFHGHSVGGTNPSLLEAMASNCFIVAHNNIFNISILGNDALYFSTSNDICKILTIQTKSENGGKINSNLEKVVGKYSWEIINKQYLDFILECLRK
ncbi:DUF1972 domain-containing protein [Apibacter adventoris]|uniref:Glycosyltransferase family 1 protein n=1 Tax=Apibacter adventoris TaxID=1679466 RepID=A0A2S8AGR8_9FLAO|nr:DUF1972 domain-containing protein [Apibacter adventoris]PQL95488.1 glycosyltransferase family 1 protein [Apibacter adventoris]